MKTSTPKISLDLQVGSKPYVFPCRNRFDPNRSGAEPPTEGNTAARTGTKAAIVGFLCVLGCLAGSLFIGGLAAVRSAVAKISPNVFPELARIRYRMVVSKSETRGRLSRDEWTTAALYALGESGPAGVAVERIATQLGTTKGSFYWHFADRSELLDCALFAWESLATNAIIDLLDPIKDPSERLQQLFLIALREPDELRMESNILRATNDATVREVVTRVHDARTDFLRRIFKDLGLSPTQVTARSRLVYAAYLGHVHLAVDDPAGFPTGPALRTYVRAITETLVS
jgi:AcrR family transcriptional regulator